MSRFLWIPQSMLMPFAEMKACRNGMGKAVKVQILREIRRHAITAAFLLRIRGAIVYYCTHRSFPSGLKIDSWTRSSQL